ncbi:MAG: hypothetical protein CSA32_01315 [Desulfobulbus propionicus]|nr:MAG: hypothetical protein CSA32_01315 [Desulfobulbus propionicus]
MDIQQYFVRSWEVFTSFFASLLGLTVVVSVCSFCSLGLLAPVLTAGYINSLLLAMRENRKPELKDAFSHMRLFLPLFGFTLIVAIALLIGYVMLILPGLLMSIALLFFCLYMLVLMVDRDMGIIDAIRKSSEMAMQPPVLEHIAVITIVGILNFLGGSIIFGGLVTAPFSTLFVLSVYEAKVVRELPGPETAGNKPPPPPPPPGG